MVRRFKLVIIGFAVLSCTVPRALLGQAPAQILYRATALSGPPPAIDGVLSEELWTSTIWDRRFKTAQGGEPSEETLFAIFYDDRYLYLAISLNDERPAEITRTPGERDETNGDRIATFFDTNLDGETSFVFVVNAAGVVRDQLGTGNGETWDNGWDAEWASGIAIEDDGWSAELRIPFSALGIDAARGQTWGLQFTRVIERREEVIMWRPVDQSRGWTASYGRLAFRE